MLCNGLGGVKVSFILKEYRALPGCQNRVENQILLLSVTSYQNINFITIYLHHRPVFFRKRRVLIFFRQGYQFADIIGNLNVPDLMMRETLGEVVLQPRYVTILERDVLW